MEATDSVGRFNSNEKGNDKAQGGMAKSGLPFALRGIVTTEKGHGASVSAMRSYKTNAPVGLMD